MIDKDKRVKVVNRTSGVVGYTIPDMGNLHRSYSARETKTVTFEEIEKLSYLPGGNYMLKNSLLIRDPEVVEELFPGFASEVPEYWYDEEQVEKLMKTGSLDAFLDCLDFAPDGVIDIIKKKAVEMPLNDISKCNAIRDKFGFDVLKAIEIDKESKVSTDEVKGSGRRTAAPVVSVEGTESKPAGRRVVKKAE